MENRLIYREKKSVLDYLAVLSILIASGTTYFYLMHAGTTLIGFLLFSLMYSIKRHFNIRSISSFTGAYTIFIFLDFFVHGLDMNLVGHAFFLTGTALILLSVGFNKFRRILLDITVVLAVISIIFQILYFLNYIDPELVYVQNDYSMGFYTYALHTFGGAVYGVHKQLAGIFWEPGIYQIALNGALLLNADLIFNFQTAKYSRIKFIIITAAIILTQSTTGYLVYGIIIIGVVLKERSKNSKKKLFLIFLAMALGVAIINSSVITGKFTEESGSYVARTNDNFVLLKMIQENPIWGYGVYSKYFTATANRYGMTGAQSNGLLVATAQYGIIWTLFFFLALVKERRKRDPNMNRWCYYLAIVMINMTEPLTFAPLLLMHILPFKYYENENTVNSYSNV